MIAYKLQHYLKRKTQGKIGYAALKLDMSKAYDRLEWPMLRSIMLKLGFGERWVSLVMECVTSVEYFVLNRTDEIGPIKPSRGIRQGDPISPYLFIIVAEGLSAMLKDYENKNKIHGLSVYRNAPTVNHLLFADDSYIFLRANPMEASNLKQLLQDYEKASG